MMSHVYTFVVLVLLKNAKANSNGKLRRNHERFFFTFWRKSTRNAIQVRVAHVMYLMRGTGHKRKVLAQWEDRVRHPPNTHCLRTKARSTWVFRPFPLRSMEVISQDIFLERAVERFRVAQEARVAVTRLVLTETQTPLRTELPLYGQQVIVRRWTFVRFYMTWGHKRCIVRRQSRSLATVPVQRNWWRAWWLSFSQLSYRFRPCCVKLLFSVCVCVCVCVCVIIVCQKR